MTEIYEFWCVVSGRALFALGYKLISLKFMVVQILIHSIGAEMTVSLIIMVLPSTTTSAWQLCLSMIKLNTPSDLLRAN